MCFRQIAFLFFIDFVSSYQMKTANEWENVEHIEIFHSIGFMRCCCYIASFYSFVHRIKLADLLYGLCVLKKNGFKIHGCGVSSGQCTSQTAAAAAVPKSSAWDWSKEGGGKKIWNNDNGHKIQTTWISPNESQFRRINNRIICVRINIF